MISLFRYLFFLILFHSVFNERDVVGKYKGYLILEKILNASIIYYNNSIVPLLKVEGNTETVAVSLETTVEPSSTTSRLTTKPSTPIVLSSTQTIINNIEDLNTTSSVYKLASLLLNNTTGPYVIITNKTDVLNTSRPVRRTNKKLDAIMEKLDGGDEREELFYEPFWQGGEYVFKRTGTKQGFYWHQLDEYRDCDKHCSVFEDKWYGRVCAARRDSNRIDMMFKNFSSMCEMERDNCADHKFRPGWFPIHRGPCRYNTKVHEFLHTYDEWYGGCTPRFWTHASSYHAAFAHFMDFTRPGHDKK